MDIVMIIIRSFVVLVILFLMVFVMGKKQVSQMNIFDYIIGITIGSIAADISLDIDKDFIGGLLSLGIYGISSIISTYMCLKSIKIREFINGKSTLLINKGKVIYDNLKKEGITIDDIEGSAREWGCFNLAYVDYAVLEVDGKISFKLKEKYSVPVNEDLGIERLDNGLRINLISDGKVMIDNLRLVSRDINWLLRVVRERGKVLSDILLFSIDGAGNIYIIDKYEKI